MSTMLCHKERLVHFVNKTECPRPLAYHIVDFRPGKFRVTETNATTILEENMRDLSSRFHGNRTFLDAVKIQLEEILKLEGERLLLEIQIQEEKERMLKESIENERKLERILANGGSEEELAAVREEAERKAEADRALLEKMEEDAANLAVRISILRHDRQAKISEMERKYEWEMMAKVPAVGGAASVRPAEKGPAAAADMEGKVQKTWPRVETNPKPGTSRSACEIGTIVEEETEMEKETVGVDGAEDGKKNKKRLPWPPQPMNLNKGAQTSLPMKGGHARNASVGQVGESSPGRSTVVVGKGNERQPPGNNNNVIQMQPRKQDHPQAELEKGPNQEGGERARDYNEPDCADCLFFLCCW